MRLLQPAEENQAPGRRVLVWPSAFGVADLQGWKGLPGDCVQLLHRSVPRPEHSFHLESQSLQRRERNLTFHGTRVGSRRPPQHEKWADSTRQRLRVWPTRPSLALRTWTLPQLGCRASAGGGCVAEGLGFPGGVPGARTH